MVDRPEGADAVAAALRGPRLNRRVTMQQVAVQAGVSVSTVSKVINGRYGISAATAAHVSGVIESLGYETSLVARSLRNQRTNVVGVLVADFEPFSTEVLKGAADAIRGSGFELVAYSAGGRVDEHVGWERRYLSRLMGTLVDGAVLVTPTVTDVDSDGPVVAIDPHTGSTTIPTVTAHNLQGAHAGVRHLLDLGHTRIAMVTGRVDLVSAQLREQGFRDALGEAGVAVDESLVVPGAFEADVARDAAQQLLGRPDRPTAVFAASDQMALAVLEVARDLGIDVPSELSLVGFDNIPESALSEPPLTTVEQPIREMGRHAVALLIDLIEGREPTDLHHTLGTDLVLRRSTSVPGGTSP